MTTSQAIAHILWQKMNQGHSGKDAVDQISSYLQANGLMALLPKIRDHVYHLYEQQKADEQLTLTTPYPIKATELQNILKKLQLQSGVVVQKKVDKTLIAGVVVKRMGKIYDGSIKRKLERLREALLINN